MFSILSFIKAPITPSAPPVSHPSQIANDIARSYANINIPYKDDHSGMHGRQIDRRRYSIGFELHNSIVMYELQASSPGHNHRHSADYTGPPFGQSGLDLYPGGWNIPGAHTSSHSTGSSGQAFTYPPHPTYPGAWAWNAKNNGYY